MLSFIFFASHVLYQNNYSLSQVLVTDQRDCEDGFHRTNHLEQNTTILSTTRESANHQLQSTNRDGVDANTRTSFWQSNTSEQNDSKPGSNENPQNTDNSLILST